MQLHIFGDFLKDIFADFRSVHRTPAQNSQREGRTLPREGRGPLFQWDVGISVGFTTETTGSLRNYKTRRTPSYVLSCVCMSPAKWVRQAEWIKIANIHFFKTL